MDTNTDVTKEPIKPIRVGVFSDLIRAEGAVDALLAAGFSQAEVTVFCPTEEEQKHFDEERPALHTGERTGSVKTAATGSAIGGVLGGLTAVAGLATIGGLPILVAGAMAGTLTGGVVGGLTGIMVSRGVEHESADFFAQAVADGMILVAVEPHHPATPQRLDKAADILHDAGAQPISLREG